MPVHDAYARITPLELSFPDPEAAGERFQGIAGEAEAREVDPADPSAFVMLMESGRAVRALRGPDDDPERVREHGVLLYHLFHAWRAGGPDYRVDTGVVRLLLESEPWETARPEPPKAAAYVQLPQHLVWVRPEGAEGTPESVDGLFWTVWGETVSFLLVMGIRPDRPGFGVVPLDPVPLDRLGEWIGTSMRPEGDDFGSTMPGADLERLYELRTAGEVLKLGARVLRYLATAPDGARTEEEPGDVPPGTGPRPSTRPHIRVSLAP